MMDEHFNEASHQAWSIAQLAAIAGVSENVAETWATSAAVTFSPGVGDPRRFDALDILRASAVVELRSFGLSTRVADQLVTEAVGKITDLVRKYKNVELRHLPALFKLRTLCVTHQGQFHVDDEDRTRARTVLIVDLARVAAHVTSSLMELIGDEEQ